MEQLPYDILEPIFTHLSLHDAFCVSLTSRNMYAHLLPYLYEKYNINKYLRKWFTRPKALLETFRQTGAILYGDHVLGYFVPDVRVLVKDSDWKLCVPWKYKNAIRNELLRQEFVLESWEDRFWGHGPERSSYHYHNSQGIRIHVQTVENCTLYDWIITARRGTFETSADMNIISGWGSASMYWKALCYRYGWLLVAKSGLPLSLGGSDCWRRKYYTRKVLVERCLKKGIRLVEPPSDCRDLDDDAFAVYFHSMGKKNTHPLYFPLKGLEMELVGTCWTSEEKSKKIWR